MRLISYGTRTGLILSIVVIIGKYYVNKEDSNGKHKIKTNITSVNFSGLNVSNGIENQILEERKSSSSVFKSPKFSDPKHSD